MNLLKSLFVLLIVLFFSISSRAQDIFSAMPSAFKSGNTTTFYKNFDKRVDITIDDISDNYSSEQAEMILKNFLGKFSNKDFSVLHKGISPNGAQYVIGNLRTNSSSYRTYIYVKKTNNVNYIQEIRFEKE